MPILLNLLGRFWYLIVIAALLGYSDWLRHEVKDAKNELVVFRAQVESSADKGKALELEKEKAREHAISDALSERDDALKRMRLAQAETRSRGNFLPAAPAAAKDSSQICFDRAALESAIRKLDQDVQGIVGQGDTSRIDAQTLLKAWPK